MGLLLRGERRRKSEALPSAPRGIRSICPTSEAAEPRGAREALCHGRLPRGSGRQGVALLRYSEDRCRRTWHSTSMRVQAARLRLWSRDCEAVELLSTQIVRKQAKAIFHFQQRSTLHATSSSTLSNSTNRWLTWQRRSFSENRRYLRLRIHRYVKTCYFIGDLRWWPVEIECITAGKSVRLQQELCGHRRTLLSQRRFRSLR